MSFYQPISKKKKNKTLGIMDVMSQFKTAAQSGYDAGVQKSKAQSYKGDSLVDYLNIQGRDSSYGARKELWNSFGFSGVYHGYYDQNSKLLEAVKNADLNAKVKYISTTKDSSGEYIPDMYDTNSQQTEAQKQAEIKKTLFTLPAFSGSIIERLNALASYMDSQVNSSSFGSLSEDEKAYAYDLALKKQTDLFREWFLGEGNGEKLKNLPSLIFNSNLPDRMAKYEKARAYYSYALAIVNQGEGVVSGLGLISAGIKTGIEIVMAALAAYGLATVGIKVYDLFFKNNGVSQEIIAKCDSWAVEAEKSNIDNEALKKDKEQALEKKSAKEYSFSDVYSK